MDYPILAGVPAPSWLAAARAGTAPVPAATVLTSSALAWILLGTAILLLPARRRLRTPAADRDTSAATVATPPARVRAAELRDGPNPAARASGPAGPALAALVAGAACVALFGTARGLVVGVVVGAGVGAALVWLQRRPTAAAPDPALPLVLDLVAAALRSGRPLADALELAAGAARADVRADLLRVCGLCRLGADAAQAWAAAASPGPLSPVVPVAVRSAQSGIKIAAAFEGLAAQLRAERAAQLAARAHRAGVLAMGPLAACFLPSFICLGVVPVIAGIATSAFHVLPGGH